MALISAAVAGIQAEEQLRGLAAAGTRPGPGLSLVGQERDCLTELAARGDKQAVIGTGLVRTGFAIEPLRLGMKRSEPFRELGTEESARSEDSVKTIAQMALAGLVGHG